MNMQMAISKVLILTVALTFGGASELAQAQQAGAPESEPAPVINGTTVNPSEGPLTPLPAAPEPQQPASAPSPAASPATQATPSTQMERGESVSQEPLGTAAAEEVPTSGGGASRPAGTAIAPAKQHQMRSLLLKIGAVAAAGVAIGTVAALSKGTSSAPSNGTRTAAAAAFSIRR